MLNILSANLAKARTACHQAKEALQTYWNNSSIVKKIKACAMVLFGAFSRPKADSGLGQTGHQVIVLVSKGFVAKVDEPAFTPTKFSVAQDSQTNALLQLPKVSDETLSKADVGITNIPAPGKLERLKQAMHVGKASVGAAIRKHPHIAAAVIAVGIFGMSKGLGVLLRKASEQVVSPDVLKSIGDEDLTLARSVQSGNPRLIEYELAVKELSLLQDTPDYSEPNVSAEPSLYAEYHEEIVAKAHNDLLWDMDPPQDMASELLEHDKQVRLVNDRYDVQDRLVQEFFKSRECVHAPSPTLASPTKPVRTTVQVNPLIMEERLAEFRKSQASVELVDTNVAPIQNWDDHSDIARELLQFDDAMRLEHARYEAAALQSKEMDARIQAFLNPVKQPSTPIPAVVPPMKQIRTIVDVNPLIMEARIEEFRNPLQQPTPLIPTAKVPPTKPVRTIVDVNPLIMEERLAEFRKSQAPVEQVEPNIAPVQNWDDHSDIARESLRFDDAMRLENSRYEAAALQSKKMEARIRAFLSPVKPPSTPIPVTASPTKPVRTIVDVNPLIMEERLAEFRKSQAPVEQVEPNIAPVQNWDDHSDIARESLRFDDAMRLENSRYEAAALQSKKMEAHIQAFLNPVKPSSTPIPVTAVPTKPVRTIVDVNPLIVEARLEEFRKSQEPVTSSPQIPVVPSSKPVRTIVDVNPLIMEARIEEFRNPLQQPTPLIPTAKVPPTKPVRTIVDVNPLIVEARLEEFRKSQEPVTSSPQIPVVPSSKPVRTIVDVNPLIMEARIEEFRNPLQQPTPLIPTAKVPPTKPVRTIVDVNPLIVEARLEEFRKSQEPVTSSPQIPVVSSSKPVRTIVDVDPLIMKARLEEFRNPLQPPTP